MSPSVATRTEHRLLSIAIAASIMAAATMAGVQAQDTQSAGAPQPDVPKSQQAKTQTTGWSLSCVVNATTKVRGCELTNSIFVNEGKQRLLAISFLPASDKDKPGTFTSQVILPHGLDFASGVTMQWGDRKPIALTPVTTDAAGIFTRASLSQKQFQEILSAEEMTVKFNGFKGDVFSVGFSLIGIGTLIANPADLMQ